MVNVNLAVFKEPRGLMKILQLLFVIIAFSSICALSGSNEIQVENSKVEISYSYPFNLEQSKIKIENEFVNLTANYQSRSQFCVFIGVMSFLYCIAAILIYVLMDDFLYQDPKMKKADFIIEAVLAFLWFVVLIVWSDVTVKLKYDVSDGFCELVKKFSIIGKCSLNVITPVTGAYVGIIASLTTLALMATGLWFLWKETAWFSGNKAEARENDYATSQAPGGAQTGGDNVSSASGAAYY